jgi:dienelactone hydrolase
LDTTGEQNADAAACLAGLTWPGQTFSVRCESAGTNNSQGDWLLRYPSPIPSGDATNDQVAIEWYVAKDAQKQPIKARAVVVIHESGRGMAAAKIMCSGLRNNRFHAFLVHLPGYGARTSEFTTNAKAMLPGLRQAIADVRRARDAVAALPFVDSSSMALQGTSMGGFIAATVGGLDRGYDRVFILLAGGDLAEVLLTGEKDAAGVRKKLMDAGLNETDIREQTKCVEPLRLAMRLNPERTWLFSGRDDEVVPPSCSAALATVAKLTGEHHLVMPVGHYSAAFLFPSVLKQMINLLNDRPMMENVPPMPNIPPPAKSK